MLHALPSVRAPLPPLSAAGFEEPLATEYTFTSQQGYAYAWLAGHIRWEHGAPSWKDAPDKPPERNWPRYPTSEQKAGGREPDIKCSLDVRVCFGDGWLGDGWDGWIGGSRLKSRGVVIV